MGWLLWGLITSLCLLVHRVTNSAKEAVRHLSYWKTSSLTANQTLVKYRHLAFCRHSRHSADAHLIEIFFTCSYKNCSLVHCSLVHSKSKFWIPTFKILAKSLQLKTFHCMLDGSSNGSQQKFRGKVNPGGRCYLTGMFGYRSATEDLKC